MDKQSAAEKNEPQIEAEDIIADEEVTEQEIVPAPENEVDDTVIPDFDAEIRLLKDQLLRAMAETENVRRRAEKQIEDAGKYAVTGFARDLISVLENLYRAEGAITAETIEETPLLKTLYEGVEMTKRELLTIFERHGITRIDPALGENFDPHLHQAVAQVPNPDIAPGTIAHVMQAGYTIKERLLRPAMVAVAKEGE